MMFDKAKFENLTGRDPYVFYNHNGERKFVARFKYGTGGKADFLRFLVKNFTPAEYFGKIAQGLPPLKVLEEKGYVSPIVKKVLKMRGYPQTQAGFAAMLADENNSREG